MPDADAPIAAPTPSLQRILEERFAGNWAAVESLCLASLAHDPANAEVAWQLAGAQWRRHDPAAAENTMRRANRLNPGNANIVAAMAQFVAEQGRYGEAQRLYERALQLNPAASTPAVDLAEIELRNGDWRRGWTRYETRLGRADRAQNSIVSIMARVAPHWTGQTLEGRTLLVYSEQGNGDDLQMARLLPALAARVQHEGGRMVLACRPSLHALFSRHFAPCVEIETQDYAQHGTPDYCLPIMSVPFALRLKPDEVRGTPYLAADTSRVAMWRARVRERTPARDALQIGLVWRGDPKHRRDAQRSMNLEALDALFSVPDVVFHPLTPGGAALPASVAQCDLTHEYQFGFEDVAAHVSTLDAIVTIDSAPLHLGGALGVPVYAMLDHVSQWAWGSAEKQRWYDSVKLFRQPRPGDWPPVVARVAQALRALAVARAQG